LKKRDSDLLKTANDECAHYTRRTSVLKSVKKKKIEINKNVYTTLSRSISWSEVGLKLPWRSQGCKMGKQPANKR